MYTMRQNYLQLMQSPPCPGGLLPSRRASPSRPSRAPSDERVTTIRLRALSTLGTLSRSRSCCMGQMEHGVTYNLSSTMMPLTWSILPEIRPSRISETTRFSTSPDEMPSVCDVNSFGCLDHSPQLGSPASAGYMA